jgi:hypothetical protein
MIRAEVRRLQRLATAAHIKLVPLDRSDLLNALATSTEIPLGSTRPDPPVGESWQAWHARGRFHHSFEVRPGDRRPLPVLVALGLDFASYEADATITVQIPFSDCKRPRRAELPVIRVSHPDKQVAVALAEEIMDAFDREGAATQALTGRHGPALVATSILAGGTRS